MEEEESTVGKNKLASIPANYVSLAQLQERWIKEKEREKNEQEQLQKEKERQEHENNEQERLQKQRQEKSDEEFRFRKRKPPTKRLNRRREVQQGKDEQRPEAVLSITTESGTNNESLKAKRKTLDPWKKKKENLRGVDEEHIAVGTQERPATSTVREDRRRPQRMNEGTSKDSALGVEGSFSRLSFNHSDRRRNDGYMKYSSSFKGGNYPGQFAANGRVWNTDRSPVGMMWVKKGSVGDTDGDACETRSLNKVVN